MRPSEIFDICHERYKASKAGRLGKLPSVDPTKVPERRWRPDRPPRLAEFVADFELAGRRALGRRPLWKRRLQLFEIYFCEGVPYRVAMRRLGLRPGTFDWWCAEIKKAVGAELARVGLFPLGRYFHEPTRSL